jgi:hypothetical protein
MRMSLIESEWKSRVSPLSRLAACSEIPMRRLK